MKINKIKLYNFNSYEGENEFDFVNQDQSKNIVLIGGVDQHIIICHFQKNK